MKFLPLTFTTYAANNVPIYCKSTVIQLVTLSKCIFETGKFDDSTKKIAVYKTIICFMKENAMKISMWQNFFSEK